MSFNGINQCVKITRAPAEEVILKITAISCSFGPSIWQLSRRRQRENDQRKRRNNEDDDNEDNDNEDNNDEKENNNNDKDNHNDYTNDSNIPLGVMNSK